MIDSNFFELERLLKSLEKMGYSSNDFDLGEGISLVTEKPAAATPAHLPTSS